MNNRRADEKIHPVTFEVAETTNHSAPQFQVRVRFNGFVTAEIGAPQATELDALEVIARGFDTTELDLDDIMADDS